MKRAQGSAPTSYRPSGALRDGLTALERLKALLAVSALPPLLSEEEAERMLALGAENVVPNIPATLAEFVRLYCVTSPFPTQAARDSWMADNSWCPAANVPPVCAQPPVFASESERAAWMRDNPSCPVPPPYCPPPPSFRSAEERAQFVASHPTCPVPPPFATVVPIIVVDDDNHVCPADQPNCHDHAHTPAPAPAPSGGGFWKGMFVAATVLGGGYLFVKQRQADEAVRGGRRNPRRSIAPIAGDRIEVQQFYGPSFCEITAVRDGVAYFESRRAGAGRCDVSDLELLGTEADGSRDWAQKRENPTAKQIVPIALGVAAIGGAVYLLKPASASAMTAPSLPSGPSPAPTPHVSTPTTPTADQRIGRGEQFTTDAPTTPAAIVTRLNGSELARQIFAFQALLYSYGSTQYLPDGADGPHTQDMVQGMNELAGDGDSRTFTPAMYAKANRALSTRRTLNKLIPSLPAATIRAVNQTIVAMAPGAPLLQVQAA